MHVPVMYPMYPVYGPCTLHLHLHHAAIMRAGLAHAGRPGRAGWIHRSASKAAPSRACWACWGWLRCHRVQLALLNLLPGAPPRHIPRRYLCASRRQASSLNASTHPAPPCASDSPSTAKPASQQECSIRLHGLCVCACVRYLDCVFERE